MTERKLLIVAIDSLDPAVLQRHAATLPTFRELMEQSPTLVAESVYPTDSIPAWMSAFSGLLPPRHGVLYVFDIFDPMLSDLTKLSTTHLQGSTFWDLCAKAGKRCVILHPILFHPPWDVNGLMITKANEETDLDEISRSMEMGVYPPQARQRYQVPEKTAKVWGGHPGDKRLAEWTQFAIDSMEKDANLARTIAQQEPWDLFFVYFNQLDIVQHRLWRFYDPSDPLHEQDPALSPLIPDMYARLDRIVAQLRADHPDAQIVVVSDHGHRVRPHKTVNLGEHLRQLGFLGSQKRPTLGARLRSTTRKAALAAITGLKLEHRVIRLVSKSETLTKVSKRVYSSKPSKGPGDAKVTVSTFAGVKSYPFGGIEVNRAVVADVDYEATRAEVIGVLSAMKTPDGQPLFRWVARREERFPGPYCAKIFPDIVFELGHDYGVGWEMHGGLYGESKDHRIASGGHSPDAVLMIANASRPVRRASARLVDLSPTMLDLMGVQVDTSTLDGKSLVRD